MSDEYTGQMNILGGVDGPAPKSGRKSTALLVGQWAAPLLIMGLYNKLVKTEGHDGSATESPIKPNH